MPDFSARFVYMYPNLKEDLKMSYVDEVFDLVVSKNPAQPEFHQAVK